MKVRTAFASLAMVVAMALVHADAHAGACVPGQQVACACPGGTSGVQACSTDGSHFDACACSAPAPVVIQQQAPPPARPSWRDEDEDEDRPRRRAHGRPGSGLFAGGLSMVIIGGLLVPVGIALVAVGGNGDCKERKVYSNYSSGTDGGLALCAVGAGLLIVDAGLIAGGIIMMVVGKNKAADAAAWRLPAWVPTKVGVSTEAVSLGWSF